MARLIQPSTFSQIKEIFLAFSQSVLITLGLFSQGVQNFPHTVSKVPWMRQRQVNQSFRSGVDCNLRLLNRYQAKPKATENHRTISNGSHFTILYNYLEMFESYFHDFRFSSAVSNENVNCF